MLILLYMYTHAELIVYRENLIKQLKVAEEYYKISKLGHETMFTISKSRYDRVKRLIAKFDAEHPEISKLA